LIIAQEDRRFYVDLLELKGGTIMNLRNLPLALAALACASTATAHPTDVTFSSRGECEAAFADSSKSDRERLVELGIFDTFGAAQSTFRDMFRCERDYDGDNWHIVFIGG